MSGRRNENGRSQPSVPEMPTLRAAIEAVLENVHPRANYGVLHASLDERGRCLVRPNDPRLVHLSRHFADFETVEWCASRYGRTVKIVAYPLGIPDAKREFLDLPALVRWSETPTGRHWLTGHLDWSFMISSPRSV
jgi:hypothetical protein